MRVVIQKQSHTTGMQGLVVSFFSVVVALGCGAVLIFAIGKDPLRAYTAMWQGSFGSTSAFLDVLLKATPLILTGLAVALAFRASYWNIGAEGQLAMGGFAATAVALFLSQKLPAPLVLPVVIAAGFAGGALWGAIPALLKVEGVHEIFTTLMMNFIAALWIDYLYFDPWKDPHGFGFPGTAEFPKVAWLPTIAGRVHIGLVLAFVVAVVLWQVLARSKWGYEIRVLGASAKAASYAGIPIAKNILLVAIASGGLAGLAGMGEVVGVSHKLQNGLTVGYGFTAIIVALLAKLHPLGIVASAMVIAGFFVGSDQLQVSMGLPAAFAQILQAVVLLSVLAGDVLSRYRVKITHTAPWRASTSVMVESQEEVSVWTEHR